MDESATSVIYHEFFKRSFSLDDSYILMRRHVFYLTSDLILHTPEATTMFPYLNSPIFHSEAKSQVTYQSTHALCTSENIRDWVPHANDCREIVMFGRSNVGKSTLINRLLRMNVTQTSKRPGKTRELMFIKLNTTSLTYLVDAPGYGFASAASKQQMKQWGNLMSYYLRNTPKDDRQTILILVDLMHGLKKIDLMLLDMLASLEKRFTIVHTKCDRANDAEFKKALDNCFQTMKRYKNMGAYLHFTSAVEESGIDQLRNHVFFRVTAQTALHSPDSENTSKKSKLS